MSAADSANIHDVCHNHCVSPGLLFGWTMLNKFDTEGHKTGTKRSIRERIEYDLGLGLFVAGAEPLG
jgi:hypothetical protein